MGYHKMCNFLIILCFYRKEDASILRGDNKFVPGEWENSVYFLKEKTTSFPLTTRERLKGWYMDYNNYNNKTTQYKMGKKSKKIFYRKRSDQ